MPSAGRAKYVAMGNLKTVRVDHGPNGMVHNPLCYRLRGQHNLAMPHWMLKSLIHRAISVLPRSDRWNELFQTYVTRSLELHPDGFEQRLSFCRRHLEHFFEAQPQHRDNFTALDVGTGWFPVVPIALYLCGASEIWTFDIAPLLRSPRLRLLLCYFNEYDQRGVLQNFLPWVEPDRMSQLRTALEGSDNESPEALLSKLNIHALVRDAQNTGLKPGSIDLFVSTTVLEYIPTGALEGLFAEFRRLASPNATMSHYIDLYDQFSAFDHSITPINFLRYSTNCWKWLRSPLIPLNRLRISDYRALHASAGFAIFKEANTSASAQALREVPLAAEFQRYSAADLLVLTSWLVSKAG